MLQFLFVGIQTLRLSVLVLSRAPIAWLLRMLAAPVSNSHSLRVVNPTQADNWNPSCRGGLTGLS